MKIWFMHDNHTFARLPSLTDNDRVVVKSAIYEKFKEDGCGLVFARGHGDRAIAHCDKWQEVNAFLDKCEEYENWEARG